jgi:tetratricopeptide (TPR) repeat protein
MQIHNDTHEADYITPDQPGGIPGWHEGIPVIRIFTCGLFTIEILQEVPEGDPAQARYAELPPERLRGRGPGSALKAVKLSISQEGRYAPKDWLMTHLRQEEEVYVTDKRLENILSYLRCHLLCLPSGKKLRDLVVYRRATKESGDGYRLAGYPLVWLDIDALAWYVKQACLKQRFGEDSLPYWEQAYALVCRGRFLIDEPSSEWAKERREAVDDQLRQCVHALAHLYLVRFGETGEEEVMRMLLPYCRMHRQDEDALRPLLELLCKRGRYQEALEWYGHLEAALEVLGSTKTGELRTPQPLTAEIAAFARLKLRESRQAEHAFVLTIDDVSQITPRVVNGTERPDGSSGVVSSIVHAQPLPSSPAIAVPGSRALSSTDITRVSEVLSHGVEMERDGPPLSARLEAFSDPLLSETRHLIGREAWLSNVVQMVQAPLPKKLIVLHGPIGIGKSSELNRLAQQFLDLDQGSFRVIAFPLFAVEERSDPEAALDVFLGMLLHESQYAPFPADASRQTLTNLVLVALKHRRQPAVILLDNAESLLMGQGVLAPCWETFLTHYLRSHHQTTLILATKEWRGWSGREHQLVAEIAVPPLTLEDSVLLLQRMGLASVPTEHLRAISERVAGIPLCLEWLAKLIHDPLVLDNWQWVDSHEETETGNSRDGIAQRLSRLLTHPDLLGEHLATQLTPLLQQMIEHHLSEAARRVLESLSVVTIPVAKPALQLLCPRPTLLKELRDASLLAAYTNRVLLLPMVASTVRRQLSAEQVYAIEERVIEALTKWVEDGHIRNDEAGNMVAELVALLLTHHRLLDVAELLIRHGWQSFRLGHGSRLAYLAQKVLQEFNWHEADEQECAGLVIVQTLLPFLGKPVDAKQYVDYQRIWNAVVTQKVTLPVLAGLSVTHALILDATNHAHFEEAQALLDTYSTSLKQKTLLLTEYAFLLRNWSDYAEGKGDMQQARHLRQRTIDIYRQLLLQTTSQQTTSPLFEANRKRSLAYYLNNLAYHLNIMGMHEEALQMVEQSLSLKEQGFVYIGALAASYGEKAEILMELGRFQEALVFYEKAIADIQRCVDAGDALSQREKWIYQVIRGRLYLRSGNMDKAEQLFREALSHIHTDRRMYRMFAQDGLNEIEQWKQQTVLPRHQLDWRWVERFRTLASYDSRWWLTWAGPFTEEEQEQWGQLFVPSLDEATKTPLGALMKVSRERELKAAIAEQREPGLHYPAIDIQDIRRRIAAQLALQEEIVRQEPNAVVRRFYQGAIGDELGYLRLIEATYEGNSELFWECNRRILPFPTRENMEYAFARVKHVVRQGLENPQTVELSQQLQEFVRTRLHLSLKLTSEEEAHPERIPLWSKETKPQSTVSAQAAKRFFTTVFQESGYEGWQVTISQNVTSAHVENGARHVYLQDKRFSLAEIRHLFIHELAGHVARCIAGDQSPLGLLGIQTKNCLPTEEGIVLYYEKQATVLRGETFDDSGLRIGTLAVGLACGVMTPPQSFLSLFTFIECYMSLVQLLTYPGANREELQKQMQQYALLICLRVYRGVPHLEQPGICYLQDVVHLHGLRLIEHAIAQDATVLDRLGVGRIALEDLPDLQELGIVSAPQPFKQRIFDPDLDAYILSFAQSEGEADTSQ